MSLARSSGRKKRIWLIFGSVAGATLIAATAAILVAANNSGHQENRAQQPVAPAATATATATTTAKPPFPDGGPIPCNPADTGGQWCLPTSITNKDLQSRVQQGLQGWKCFNYNDPAAPIDSGADNAVGVCLGKNSKDQNYTWGQYLSWDNLQHSDQIPLESVTATTSVGFVPAQGQSASMSDANAAAENAFNNLLAIVWPHNDALARPLLDAYRIVKQKCDSASGQLFNGSEQLSTVGYKISCYPPNPMTTTDPQGRSVTVYTASATISGPFGGEVQKSLNGGGDTSH